MTNNYDVSNATLEVQTSEDIGAEFYAAFVAAQAKIGPAIADKENTFFKQGGKASKYADLAAVTEAMRGPFAENGLAVMQFPFTRTGTVERSYREKTYTDNGKEVSRPLYFDDGAPMMETVAVIYVVVRTRVIHQSGQWLEQDLEIPVVMGHNPAQDVGKVTTYAQRYALRSIAGVPTEDDDGEGLSSPDQPGAPRGPSMAQRRPSNKPEAPTRPQGTAGRIQSVIDRLDTAENLATLRFLHEAAFKEIEAKGSDEDMTKLEEVKDRNKARLSAEPEQPAEPEQSAEPEQNAQPRGVKQGVRTAGRQINF